MKTQINKYRKIAGWLIAAPITALMLFSASGKIMNPEMMVQMNLGSWATLVIIGEIVSALLFLFPRTSIFGTVLLSSYLGGAIIIHMTGGSSILMPAGVLVMVWIGSIYETELLQDFNQMKIDDEKGRFERTKSCNKSHLSPAS
jgi:hypothetical protein